MDLSKLGHWVAPWFRARLARTRAIFSLFLLLLLGSSARGVEATWEYAVQLTATFEQNQITLSWPQDSYAVPYQYVVYRKDRSATDWGSGTTLPGTATRFVDSNVVPGRGYEYQVHKISTGYQGYGYIYAGSELPIVEARGKLILVVEQSQAVALRSELDLLVQDLVGDGWEVIRLDVARDTAVRTVRSMIQGVYWSDPANVKAALLFGHVPVAYSGYIWPDEHPEHRGAWPSDAFYADMDGTWSDYVVNTTSATDPRNRNVPGDGKFDPSQLPSLVELQVGRVDLANLPGRLTWDGQPTLPDETTLLRRYLVKNHAFRHRNFSLPARAVVYDGFGIGDGEAIAASAWRNFAPFFGAQNIFRLDTAGQWLPVMRETPCLWAFACGAGTHTSMAGIGSRSTDKVALTTDIVSEDPKAVFFMGNGSWFGDWDHEDNFMRAFLATPTYGLAYVWAGSPHWYMHHLAMGDTLGAATQLTQNNPSGGLYRNQANPGVHQVHIALMGDPTLRLHPVAPPQNFTARAVPGAVDLVWSAPSAEILGFHVYRSAQPLGPFTRISTGLIKTNVFYDSAPLTGANTYMVRAVKLEVTPSGSYYNPSQGVFATVQALPAPLPIVAVVAKDPLASRVGPDPASFQFSRTVSLNSELTVRFSLGGSATNGIDYRGSAGNLPETFIIPAGSSNATLTIQPMPANELTGAKSVVVTLSPSPDYQVGSPGSAVVTIEGNSVPARALAARKGEVRLEWLATAGAYYRIICKDNPLAPTWTSLPGEIQPSSTNAFYQEPATTSRFYRVYQSR